MEWEVTVVWNREVGEEEDKEEQEAGREEDAKAGEEEVAWETGETEVAWETEVGECNGEGDEHGRKSGAWKVEDPEEENSGLEEVDQTGGGL